MDIYTLHRGTAPLFVSLPHDGTALPADIAARLTPAARRVPDTDWHVSRLYAFARELGASMIVPKYSRYVVDLNRPPDDVSLYPGQNTTGLCPTRAFTGELIYLPGAEPDAEEIAGASNGIGARIMQRSQRRSRGSSSSTVASCCGKAIRSAASCRSCSTGVCPISISAPPAARVARADLQRRLVAALEAQKKYTFAVNGRFKGGYITRHYGDPAGSIEAVQLELAQLNYMDEDSFEYRDDLAASTQALIRKLLEVTLATKHS